MQRVSCLFYPFNISIRFFTQKNKFPNIIFFRRKIEELRKETKVQSEVLKGKDCKRNKK